MDLTEKEVKVLMCNTWRDSGKIHNPVVLSDYVDEAMKQITKERKLNIKIK